MTIELVLKSLPKIIPPCKLYICFDPVAGGAQLTIHPYTKNSPIFLLDIPEGSDMAEVSQKLLDRLEDIEKFASHAYGENGEFVDPGLVLLWTESFRQEMGNQLVAMRFDLWFDRETTENRLRSGETPEAIAADLHPIIGESGITISISPEDGAKLIRKEFGLEEDEDEDKQ